MSDRMANLAFYPTTERDEAICAAALAIVEQAGTISMLEHLDALVLTVSPHHCKVFLNESDRAKLDEAFRKAPPHLSRGFDESVKWVECRDHLAMRDAITISQGDHGRLFNPGPALSSVKASLPSGTDDVVRYVLKALERIREIRRGLKGLF